MKRCRHFSWIYFFKALILVAALLHTELYFSSTKAYGQDLTGMAQEELKGKTKDGISDAAKNVSKGDDEDKEFAGQLAGELSEGLLDSANDTVDIGKDAINFLSEDVYDYVQLLVNNVTLIALAVMAGSLIILCPTIKVISVDIFVVSAVAWIVSEILFYVAYMLFSVKSAKQFKYDKGKGLDEQIESLKAMEKNASKLGILMTAQVVVYQVLAAALASAAAMSTAEAALLYLFKANALATKQKGKASSFAYAKASEAVKKCYESGDLDALPNSMTQTLGTLYQYGIITRSAMDGFGLNGDTPSSECDKVSLGGLGVKLKALKAGNKKEDAAENLGSKGQDANEQAASRLVNAANATPQPADDAAAEIAKKKEEATTKCIQISEKLQNQVTVVDNRLKDAHFKSQFELATIKEKVLLECRAISPIKCKPINIGDCNFNLRPKSSPSWGMFLGETFKILGLPNVFALDLGSMFGGGGGNSSGGGGGGLSMDSFTSILGGEGGFKLIFYFLDVVIAAVVIAIVYVFRGVIQKFIVHPITRTILFWVIYGIGQVAVVLMGLVVTRVLYRSSEYTAIRKILENKKDKEDKDIENEIKAIESTGGAPSSGTPSTTDTSISSSTGTKNVANTSGSVGYSGGLSASSSAKISDALDEFSGTNCMKADSKDPRVMAGVDANCECLKTNTCYNVRTPITSNGAISALGGNKVLAEAASAIGNKLATGDYKGAFNLAMAPVVRKAVNEVKKSSKEVPGRLEQIMKKYPDQASIDIDKAKKEILKPIADSTAKLKDKSSANANFNDMALAGKTGIDEEEPKTSIDDFAKQMGVSENAAGKTAKSDGKPADEFKMDDIDFGDMGLKMDGNGDQNINQPELLDANLNEGDYRPSTVEENDNVSIFDIIHYRYIKTFTKMNEKRAEEKQAE